MTLIRLTMRLLYMKMTAEVALKAEVEVALEVKVQGEAITDSLNANYVTEDILHGDVNPT